MLCPTSNGRLVPKPEVAASFNHIVCQGKHLCWDNEAWRLLRWSSSQMQFARGDIFPERFWYRDWPMARPH